VLRILGLLWSSRRRRKNTCKVVNGWCVRHVGEYYCVTHNYVWRQGDMPCVGREVN
jgi:hypothetical protein